MDNYTIEDIVAMLAALYKKIDDLERHVKGNGSRMFVALETYLRELEREASKLT